MNGRLEIDESRSPVILFTFHGVFSDAYFDEYLAKLTQIVNRPERRALIYDIRNSGMVPAAQRQKQAAWMAKHQLITRASTAGMAFVLDAAMLRGILTAILWVQPLACPHAVLSTLDQAYTWCEQQLRGGDPSSTRLQR